jgi:antitoxin (DNA-binding transcriptional repressor) of toxin-antitoxin stability system
MALIGSRVLQRDMRSILDAIEEHGETVVVLRHGRPVAALVPIDDEQAEALVLGSSREFRERRLAREVATGEAAADVAMASPAKAAARVVKPIAASEAVDPARLATHLAGQLRDIVAQSDLLKTLVVERSAGEPTAETAPSPASEAAAESGPGAAPAAADAEA